MQTTAECAVHTRPQHTWLEKSFLNYKTTLALFVLVGTVHIESCQVVNWRDMCVMRRACKNIGQCCINTHDILFLNLMTPS